MGTSYAEEWKIMVDALKIEGRKFEISEKGVMWIKDGGRKILVEISGTRGLVEIRNGECCRKIIVSSEKVLCAMAKIGVISIKSLIASAFINLGYKRALELKRCYEKIRV